MRFVRGRWFRLAAVAALVMVLACTGDPPDPAATDDAAAPGDGDAGGEPTLEPQARIRLEHELGLHTMLIIDALRAAADDAPRLRHARRLLNRNTERLTEAVAEVLDAEPSEFAELWTSRTQALLAVAEGEDSDDLEAAQEAYGQYVGDALPGVAAEEATQPLVAHDDQLLEGLAAHRDDDVPQSYTLQREAFSQMFGLGGDLAVAAGAPSSGAVELRSALHQLLGEHTWLTVLTAQRTARGARDARHPGAALNGNTEDITAALLSIYDEQTALEFDERWRALIADLMLFTVAVAEEDTGQRRAARRSLRETASNLGVVLAETTEGAIDAEAGSEAIAAHLQVLRRHSALSANNRFRTAFNTADRAYANVGDLADLIAEGIADHRPDEFRQ